MRWGALALAALLCGCSAQGPVEAEKAEQCMTNLQGLWEPMEFYMTDHHGQYPARLEQLTSPGPARQLPYVSSLPTCPPGWSYVYEVQPGTVSRYTLICRSQVSAPGLTPDYPRMTSESRPVSHP
ncbi:MAG: hypothetical protein AMXMBFR33_52800 [Candidatus Xenobia bacterium]